MTSKVAPTGLTPTHIKVGPDTRFFTNKKGKKIHCSVWRPNTKVEIRGLVFICHGFSEHLQWYEDLALRLNTAGMLAFGHDHVGHGRSEGVRGHVDTVEDYVNDVLAHCDEMVANHPSLPCFMVGHSMGGMIAIRTAMTRPQFFKGVVLMGPLIKANPVEATPSKLFLVKLMSRCLPQLMISKLKLDHVTRDEEMKNRMEKDPLRYMGGVRARWAMAGIETLAYFEQHIPEVDWPFLVLHGEHDHLCSPDGSRMLMEKSCSKDKTLKIFPSAFHHLYLEVPEVRHEALQDTVDWIAART